MRVFGLILVMALASAACSPEAEAPEPRSTASSETPAPPAPLDPAGCPVDDDAFCGTAFDVATAMSRRDGGSLVPLSRSTTIDCDEVARRYFPACASEDVLQGYGISGADFLVEVLGRKAYRQQLEAVIGAIDPSYSDELGGGSAQVLGVGTCGPDIPGRRTYHLAWTAAAAEAGRAPERMLGSFELTLEDREWRIALWYLERSSDGRPSRPTRSPVPSARPGSTRGRRDVQRHGARVVLALYVARCARSAASTSSTCSPRCEARTA